MSDPTRHPEGLRAAAARNVVKALDEVRQELENGINPGGDPRRRGYAAQGINKNIRELNGPIDALTRQGRDAAEKNLRIRWAAFVHAWNNGNGNWATCLEQTPALITYASAL